MATGPLVSVREYLSTSYRPWRCTPGGTQEVAELRTEDPETLVPVRDLFA